MRTSLARAALILATHCLPQKDHAWGLAMQAELEQAIEAGQPLRFAVGCLAASLWRMPAQEEGRFSLTAHGLAIGLMVPVAAAQISGAIFGISRFLNTGGVAAVGSLQRAFLASAYQAGVPLLAMLALFLAAGHLRMAWVLLDRDWARVETSAAFTLAAAITSIVLLGLLEFDVAQAVRQCAIVVIELAGLVMLARWHTHLPGLACADTSTG